MGDDNEGVVRMLAVVIIMTVVTIAEENERVDETVGSCESVVW